MSLRNPKSWLLGALVRQGAKEEPRLLKDIVIKTTFTQQLTSWQGTARVRCYQTFQSQSGNKPGRIEQGERSDLNSLSLTVEEQRSRSISSLNIQSSLMVRTRDSTILHMWNCQET